MSKTKSDYYDRIYWDSSPGWFKLDGAGRIVPITRGAANLLDPGRRDFDKATTEALYHAIVDPGVSLKRKALLAACRLV